MNNNATTDDNGFLFNVDILIKSRSNALALQHLLEMLNNHEEVIDFRVKSGLELGEIIDTLIQAKKRSVISKVSKSSTLNESSPSTKIENTAKTNSAKGASLPEKEKKPAAASTPVPPESDPYEWIKIYSKDNRLVRLTANRNGKQVSLPCRILNYDDSNQLVNVYHVDEKQVYTFNVNEIDEFSTS
ncbi:hypothetical protein MNQ98_23030 [Paenibacillus sp. N3/727]|uniref:hypothetical protein n=1 Tax=Paenibacillus sp. N3/727 TaxID=2925845 RepID=UPI001F52BCA9|nr:hypothetical protein [Paenibacillus sp. N3/727]UNK17325.1 hypothetical protein MNQ98_23030 [Paenibacillus sp. N3/727]